MDLSCPESLGIDCEPSLYCYKHQRPLTELQQPQTDHQQHYKPIHSSTCSSSSMCSSTGSSIGSVHEIPAASSNSNFDATIVNTPRHTSHGACNRRQCAYVSTSTAETVGKPDSSSIDHVNNNSERVYISDGNQVNMAIEDPTFKRYRCLTIALKIEKNHQAINKTYFDTVQMDITPAMRKIVAEWMMEVCLEVKCQEEVVLLAIYYLDLFLSSKSVRKTHLQILAAACLLLASKLREPIPHALSVDVLVFYTDNSIFKEDLIKWELLVLSRLGWDLSVVTALDFLDLLIIRLPIENFPHLGKIVREHAQAFISLAAKEHVFTEYTASTIAASSIAASMSGLKWHLCTHQSMQFLLDMLTDLTRVEQNLLQGCIVKMERIFKEHSRRLQKYLVSNEYFYLNPSENNLPYESEEQQVLHSYEHQSQQATTPPSMVQAIAASGTVNVAAAAAAK